MSDLIPLDSCKVYTPRPVADAMVRALRTERRATWLEPCVGKGVFLSALAEAGVSPRRITAIDLDRAECDTDSFAITKRGVDFLSWSQSQSDRAQFDRIVGNPPYISLSRLNPVMRAIATSVRIPDGEQTVPHTSNIWFAFLCRCLSLLRKGGGLALLLPAAWDFADYAGELRETIPRLFEDFSTFRSRRPIFDDVQDGSVVIVGRGFRLTPRHKRRLECRDRDDLVASIDSMCTSQSAQSTDKSNVRGTDDRVPLGELVEIRLGGVTGDVDYFLLTDDQRRGFELPDGAVKPVLTRSRHLTAAVIDRDAWRSLLRKGERVWLFDPTDEVCSHPSVVRYLSRTPQDGGCDRQRYKISRRDPWYRTPLPDRVDGFMSGMTRTGPWLALRGMRSLNATNTLYVVRFKASAGLASKSALALAMITSGVRDELRRVCRHYADGLMKHEPGDLMSITVPSLRDSQDSLPAYRQAVRKLLGRKDEDASAIADEYFADLLARGANREKRRVAPLFPSDKRLNPSTP